MIQGGGTETDIGFSPQNSIGVGHTHKHTNKHTHRSTYRGGCPPKNTNSNFPCITITSLTPLAQSQNTWSKIIISYLKRNMTNLSPKFPIPGKTWNLSLISGSTAVVTILTWGNAYAMLWTPASNVYYHESNWRVKMVRPDTAMSRDTRLMFSSGTSWSSKTRMAIMAAAPVATVASWENQGK